MAENKATVVKAGTPTEVSAPSSEGDSPNTPEESKNASLRVTPVYPVGSFVVEDVPEITAAGTMLTAAQFKKADAAAAASGVTLVSEEVK